MTAIDALGAGVCLWLALRWLTIGQMMASTGRHPEAWLCRFASANAALIVAASAFITLAPTNLEGILVRLPALPSLALGFSVVGYVRRKAAGELPAGAL